MEGGAVAETAVPSPLLYAVPVSPGAWDPDDALENLASPKPLDSGLGSLIINGETDRSINANSDFDEYTNFPEIKPLDDDSDSDIVNLFNS